MSGSDGILISSSLAEILELIPREKLSYIEREDLRRAVKKELASRGVSDKKALAKELEARVETAETERKATRRLALEQSIGEVLIVQLKTINGQVNTGDFRITGIYEARVDFAAYVDRTVLNRILAMGESEYNILGIFLKNTAGIDAQTIQLQRELEKTVPMFAYEKVVGRSSNELQGVINREEFSGSMGMVTNLNNELGIWGKIDMFALAASLAVMLVILLVIMVGIVNTYRIIVQERTKEIGTLRAVGTLRKDVRNMFVLEALFLALGGLVAGTAVAILALFLISIPEFSTFAELAWFLDKGHLAFAVQPPVLVATLLIVGVSTIIAALIPAGKAARLKPAQAFRGTF
jgi:putative ABC transport system permease protein